MPYYGFSVYNIDTKSVISHTYYTRYGSDHIKIKNNKVSEYYQMQTKNGLSFISYDVDTGRSLEYYTSIDNVQRKYDYYTHELMQESFLIDEYMELPQDFRDNLKGSVVTPLTPILCYGRKPYGRIVEYVGPLP